MGFRRAAQALTTIGQVSGGAEQASVPPARDERRAARVAEVLRPPLSVRVALILCGIACALGVLGAAARLGQTPPIISAMRVLLMTMAGLAAGLAVRRRVELSEETVRVVDGLLTWSRPWQEVNGLLQYRAYLVILAGACGCRIGWLGARQRDRLLRAVLQRAGLRVAAGALPAGALARYARWRPPTAGARGSSE